MLVPALGMINFFNLWYYLPAKLLKWDINFYGICFSNLFLGHMAAFAM